MYTGRHIGRGTPWYVHTGRNIGRGTSCYTHREAYRERYTLLHPEVYPGRYPVHTLRYTLVGTPSAQSGPLSLCVHPLRRVVLSPRVHPFHCWASKDCSHHYPFHCWASKDCSLSTTRFTVGQERSTLSLPPVSLLGKKKGSLPATRFTVGLGREACWEESLCVMLGREPGCHAGKRDTPPWVVGGGIYHSTIPLLVTLISYYPS